MGKFLSIFIMSLEKILAGIFGILALLAVITWLSQFPDYQACLKNPRIDNNDCFMEFFMMSPPIKEVTDLAEVCNETDTECLAKIGMKAIETKVTK